MTVAAQRNILRKSTQRTIVFILFKFQKVAVLTSGGTENPNTFVARLITISQEFN